MAGEGVAPRKRAPRKKAAPAPKKAAPAPVEVFDPAHAAHELRLTGMDWRAVAKITGYPTQDACRVAVSAYLTKAAALLSKEQQLERLAAELDRLDVLTHAYWTMAVSGDVNAAKFVLDVSKQRARLLKLETDEKEAGTTRTIVVSGSEADYVQSLKRVIEDQAG